MRDVLRRIGMLETQSAPLGDVTLESSDRDLCRFLAQHRPHALRAQLPNLSDLEYADVIQTIRAHVPGYGASAQTKEA